MKTCIFRAGLNIMMHGILLMRGGMELQSQADEKLMVHRGNGEED